MIQRPQSLFFFLSAIFSTFIIHLFPIFELKTLTETTLPDIVLPEEMFFLKHYFYANISLLLSAAVATFSIFQFKYRVRQRILSWLSRFLILICVLLLLFFYSNEELAISIQGLLCLFVSWSSLQLANFFIKRDEKLISSADRIR